MSNIEKVLYTGKTHVTGGRDGAAVSADGRLNVPLAHFASSGAGTNPEQLLGAGWGACYLGALGMVAKEAGVTVPKDAAVDVEVDLGLAGASDYRLQARFKVSLPGIAADVAAALAAKAHTFCPYSKALHGPLNVTTVIA